MDLNRNNSIENIPKLLNVVIGALIVLAFTDIVLSAFAGTESEPSSSKRKVTKKVIKKTERGINVGYFLYSGKMSSKMNSSLLNQFNIDIEDIELRGTMISEESSQSIAFLNNPIGDSKIMAIGDTYLNATLTKIGPKSVTFNKGETEVFLRLSTTLNMPGAAKGANRAKTARKEGKKKRRKKQR